MKYSVSVWDRLAAYTITEHFTSDEQAISFAKSRASKFNNVRLYSCEKKQTIFNHVSA